MKCALSIVLLVIFLFNQVGYYGVHWLALQRHQAETLRKLDNNDVAGFETTTLSIPLSIPYSTSTPDYERIKGDFEYHGEHYKLVQQKLENDTLYVVCIRDVNEEQLHHALHDFIKLSHTDATDFKTFKLLGSVCKDFHHTHHPELQNTSGWSFNLNHPHAAYSLRQPTYPGSTPPPRV